MSNQKAAGDTSAVSEHKATFDALRWVIQIRHTLDEEVEEEDGVSVSIFNVPKSLRSGKPEAYTPQLIAFGPYHHWRPELSEMEGYKLSSAKRTQRHLPNSKFQPLVDCFAKHEHRIRSHYHKYLDVSGEVLAWMMAMDVSFLLEFLQTHAVDEGGKILHRLSSRMSHLVDHAGRKAAHNSILKDAVMLENQVPLFLLRKLLELRFSSADLGDSYLQKMTTGFLKELCPFKLMEDFPCIDVTRRAHLLEALYHVLMPQRLEEGKDDNDDEIEEQNEGDDGGSGERLKTDPTFVGQLLDSVWGFASGSNGGPVRYIRQVMVSRPVTFVVKAPWKILTSIPGFSFLKQPVEYLFSQEKEKKEDGRGASGDGSSPGDNKPPLIEEITIPSVTELVSAGVRFQPTGGDVTSIDFDPKKAILYLPSVTLDGNTDVVLRNLVAYEAAAGGAPLVLARYTELMNGIVDTEEDVRLLRRSGVIINRMKKDVQAADVWNGMTRSVRLTRVEFLDRVVAEVNRYHSRRWKVKTGKFMKKYVFGSWPFLTFLAAVLLLLLNGLQTFCSVYSCARWFHVIQTTPAAAQG